jgi:hypothetical protein
MSATITDKFKKEILQDLHTSFHSTFDSGADPDSSDYYFIGIGRSQEWPDNDEPPAPTPSVESITSFQSSLSGVKRVLDQSYVVPRYNWTAGSVYVPWSDKHHSDITVGALQDIFGPYYVITEENNVYVCLSQGMDNEGKVNNSIYKPQEIHTQPFVAGPDGYVWRFLYNVGTYNSRRYLTSEWLPVEHILDSTQGGPAADTLSASRLGQALVQLQSKEGQILSIEVDSGGIGYDSSTTVTINEDPFNPPSKTAYAYPRVDQNGRIFQVILKDSINAPYFSLGEGYNHKTWITVNGSGSGASLRASVHKDTGGLGFDPRNDLNSSSMMYSVRLIGDELKTMNIDNDFRQVGLIKNPLIDGKYSGGVCVNPDEISDTYGTYDIDQWITYRYGHLSSNKILCSVPDGTIATAVNEEYLSVMGRPVEQSMMNTRVNKVNQLIAAGTHSEATAIEYMRNEVATEYSLYDEKLGPIIGISSYCDREDGVCVEPDPASDSYASYDLGQMVSYKNGHVSDELALCNTPYGSWPTQINDEYLSVTGRPVERPSMRKRIEKIEGLIDAGTHTEEEALANMRNNIAVNYEEFEATLGPILGITSLCDRDYGISDNYFLGLRGNALKKLYVRSGINAEFTNLDNTVTGLSSGATALLDYYSVEVDSDCCDLSNNVTNNILYVHQTAETGYTPFHVDESVELNFNGGIAAIVRHSDSSVPALRPADVDAYSGEVMYIDNRLYIERDADQTEDIKIIIDL